ncbi:hypothetical protein OCK74_06095 [Chitinophagaceae bacterium LB-8]|jgi:hypothetical protein|uniref:Uncharacterized protein n=1 Tax=Paraflavisolibacter caeni TaxID=2982496 RepID=A0A9X3BFE7_9BACT|nr:hypothetical protein [Paraflavisolibacter caeni]MCU7548679.1 hypothetical protein [Paraflavisolibacter caeni]
MSMTVVMSTTDMVFKVNGKNVESLVFTEKALLLSSQSFATVDDFKQAWAKTLTLATRTEIKFDAIKSVTKEDSEETIVIKYKGKLGMPSECSFSFSNKGDLDLFYDFLEHEQYFKRIDERLSPLLAAKPYIVGLIITIGITFLAHFQAIRIASGVAKESGYRKARLFHHIIELIGDNGVWTIGGLVTCYIVYKIWSRFTNPPGQTRFLPF